MHGDVDVQSVLNHFGFGYPLEGKLRPTWGKDVAPVGVSFADFAAQDGRPELGQLARLAAVDDYFVHRPQHSLELSNAAISVVVHMWSATPAAGPGIPASRAGRR